jgi:hypothetical protein
MSVFGGRIQPINASTVLVHPDDRRVDHLNGCVMRDGQRVHDSAPDASLTPANEPIIASSIGAKRLRQIAPRCAGSQDPKDAVQDTAVVHTRDTARLVRQHRLDGRPLVVGEFVAHDSRLQFGGLNHTPGDAINPQRPIVADANTLISLSLSGGLCCQSIFDISTRNKDST